MKLVFIFLLFQLVLLINASNSTSWSNYCPQCGIANSKENCCCLEKVNGLTQCDQIRKIKKEDKGICCDYKAN